MAQPLTPIPQYDPLVEKVSFKMNDRWYRWLSDVLTRLLQSVLALAAVHRVALTGSIGTATVYTPTQPGVYRVSWSIQVTTAATTSSSIAVTLGWKTGPTATPVAQTEAFAAITGNTTGTHGSGSVVIYPTSAQPITYQTTYASVGGTSMAYQVDVVVEELT